MNKPKEIPDPHSADYQLKDGQITELSVSIGNPTSLDEALINLSRTLAVNSLLSNKQKSNLTSSLFQGRLLSYRPQYFQAWRELDQQNIDEEILEREQAKLRNTVDGASWDIELNADLQTQAVRVVATLADPSLPLQDRVSVTASLLNVAHRAINSENIFEDVFEDDYKRSAERMEETEESVYEQRFLYLQELLKAGVIDPEEAGELDTDLAGFKALREYGDLYDRLVAYHFIRHAPTQNVVELFKYLQKVLHFGYTMGIRDGVNSNQRLQSETG